MGLISELRRRNVLRMAVLYAIAAWLIMQVAEVIMDLANLPDWIGPTILGLLAVGFPIALIFSWFYELTPEGLSLEKDVDRAESITHVTGRRLDFIVISLLLAAVILFAYDKWWIGGPPEQSIAVLAFDNMSADPDQEYFSDGISEELLNLLAQIPELTVISRSSSFSFKGKDIAIPTLAEQLNVAHVLEGSVRKVGNRVRITAQLIDARSDSHLWSASYERNLDDGGKHVPKSDVQGIHERGRDQVSTNRQATGYHERSGNNVELIRPCARHHADHSRRRRCFLYRGVRGSHCMAHAGTVRAGLSRRRGGNTLSWRGPGRL